MSQRLLLHACCGPCSTSCVERLRAEGIEPVLFYANDNLASREEYDRRLGALRTFAEAEGVEVRAKPYDHDAWREAVRGMEAEPEGGRRCSACFRHSLAAAAAEAGRDGFDGFSTTLTVSPHKRTAQVFEAGHAVETPAAPFREHDFKKRGGFLRSVVLAARYGLYRQSFCGCEHSLRASEDRRGQAVVELTIALFCILLLVGGLLQLVILAHSDTETMAEATARASEAAATGGSFAESFSPVRDWRPGRDGMILTRDDREVGGSLAGPRQDIASRTAPDGDWSALDAADRTDIRSFAENGASAAFGFVHAHAEQEVEVLPFCRALFGLREARTGNDVWMVKVGDLY